MKKLLWISAFLLFATTSAMAQGIHFGLKGGVNMAKIDGQQFKDGFNLSYYGGGFLELALSEKFGIQPEVLFSQSTYETAEGFDDIGFPDIQGDDKIKLNYLNIPILANIKLSDQLWIQLGPQYSILMDQDESLVDNGKQAFKNGNFSAVGGLVLSLGSLRVNARYVVGLSEVNDITQKDSWKSQAIQLGIGYQIF